jgi:hypothetical protein
MRPFYEIRRQLGGCRCVLLSLVNHWDSEKTKYRALCRYFNAAASHEFMLSLGHRPKSLYL